MSLVLVSRAIPPCPACTEAKKKLLATGTPYTESDVSDPGVMETLKRFGVRSIPAFFERSDVTGDWVYLGGYTYLK